MKIVRKFDSSAHLVMKSHQENALRTFPSFSSDFCDAITTLQDQKVFPSHPVEFCWLARNQKEPKGPTQERSLGQTKLVGAHLLLEAMQDALTQQGKSSAAIHHSLNELDPSHLPFCLRIVVGAR